MTARERPKAPGGRDGLEPLGGSRSVEQAVASALRRAVLDGSLPAGTRLTVRDVAARFGVSVTPVRIALKELSSEGLVELRPHTGAWVTPLSREELEEIMLTRAGLEPWLARLGARALDGAGLRGLDERLADVVRATESDDRDAYLETSWALRRVCYEAAERPRLLARVTALFELSHRYHLVNLGDAARLRRSCAFMVAFHDACARGDADGAETVMREAIEWTLLYLTEGTGLEA